MISLAKAETKQGRVCSEILIEFPTFHFTPAPCHTLSHFAFIASEKGVLAERSEVGVEGEDNLKFGVSKA